MSRFTQWKREVKYDPVGSPPVYHYDESALTWHKIRKGVSRRVAENCGRGLYLKMKKLAKEINNG